MKVDSKPHIQQFYCDLKQIYFTKKYKASLKGKQTLFEKKWCAIANFLKSQKDQYHMNYSVCQLHPMYHFAVSTL